MMLPTSLLERLHGWANEQPEKKAWTFLNDKADATDSYTYKVCAICHFQVL